MLPPAWSTCASLTAIDISNNLGISGTLPGTWSSLSQLHSISLSGLALSGTLPDAWGTLPAIQRIDLAAGPGAALSSTLPSSWAFAASWAFKSLDLSGQSGLTGELAAGVRHCWGCCRCN